MRYLVPIIALFLGACSGSEREAEENNKVGEPAGSPTISLIHNYSKKDSSRVSFRGLSVREDVIWVSGSSGTILKSINEGESWEDVSPVNFKDRDFRDVHAFTADRAVAMSIASPGYLILTEDGGLNWDTSYVNHDSLVFMDAIDFWNTDTGLVFGDQLNGDFFILKTVNGGKTWERLQVGFKPFPSENGFAASGTSLILGSEGTAWIGTGGERPRVLVTHDYGTSWSFYEVPIAGGNGSKGIYSLASNNKSTLLAVGGNWEETVSDSVAAISTDKGKSWTLIIDSIPNGYRSACAFGGAKMEYALCGGTSGTDWSGDGGKTWSNLADINLNVIEFSPNQNVGFAADGKGNIYKIIIK